MSPSFCQNLPTDQMDKLVALIDAQAGVDVFAKAFRGNGVLKIASDKKGNTLLHLATAKGCAEIVQYLLQQHVSVSAANHEGQTAVHIAAFTSDPAAMRLLLDVVSSLPDKARKGVLNAKDKDQSATALHYAAKSGSDSNIRQLLDAGADADILSFARHTALHSAASHAHLAAVTQLLQGGARLNLPVSAANPLHATASTGNLEVVKCLLAASDAHTAVRASDSKGSSVLHYAISSGKPATQLVPLLEALLHHGADIDTADAQGMTALHQAAKSSPCAVVELLLSHGAGVSLCASCLSIDPLGVACPPVFACAVLCLAALRWTAGLPCPALPCSALPCPALCCAVLCCAGMSWAGL